MSFFHCRIAAAGIMFGLCPLVVSAEEAAVPADQQTGSLTVFLQSVNGTRVASGSCSLILTTIKNRISADAAGACTFERIAPGVYQLDVAAPGFLPQTITDIAVLGGSASTVRCTLSQPTLSSLTVIGRTVSSSRAQSINTSAAAISVITSEMLESQPNPNILNALQQLPGVQIALVNDRTQNAFNNGSVLVRGGTAWETAQLIDGHALPLNASGRFVSSIFDDLIFKDIEITKGPGAITPVVNNAINGTVNYRLREPTAHLRGRIAEGYDGWGGSSTEAFASGPLSQKLGFVIAYGVQGSNGYNGGTTFENFLPGPNYQINGRAIATSPYKAGSYPADILNPLPFGSTTLESRGAKVMGAYAEHTGLGRLRYRLSESTDITLTSFSNSFGAQFAQPLSVPTVFTPGSGYQGSSGPAAETTLTNLLFNYPRYDWFGNFQLYELEARTQSSVDTFMARYYAMSYKNLLNIPANDSNLSYTAPFRVWGTVSLCPIGTPATQGKCGPSMTNPTVTAFNGETVNLTTPDEAFTSRTLDQLRGGSLEWDHPFGPHVVSVSLDHTLQTSVFSQYQAANGQFVQTGAYPAGTSMATMSALVRLQLNPTDRVLISPALYYNVDSWRTSPDGGTTWRAAAVAHLDPRLSVTYRPSGSASLRFAIGSSIAPPYLSALASSSHGPPVFNNTTSVGPFYFAFVANPKLRPETAFGYNAGADFRLRDGQTVLAFDAFETTVSNQLFTQIVPNGTFDDGRNGTHPVYLITTANVGRARDAGVEFSIRRQPPRGIGFVVQGSLQRSYPYDLPSSLYGFPGLPPSVNLTAVPNVNFQFAVGAAGGIPHSQGYGGISYRGANDIFASFGATYTGRNNTYALPAFVVVSGTVRRALTKNVSLQFAAENLTNYRAGYLSPFFGSYYERTNLVTITRKQMVVPVQVLPPMTIRTTLSYSI